MPKPLHTYLAPGPEIENDSVFFNRENGCFYERIEGFTQVVYDPALVVRITFDRLRDSELLASAKSGPFGKRTDLSSDFWRSIIRRDVDWEFDAVPKYGLVAIEVRDTSAEELSAAGKAPKRRGPKPETALAMKRVFCEALNDPDEFALVCRMSQEGRRKFVRHKLTLARDEGPSRSYVHTVWENWRAQEKLHADPLGQAQGPQTANGAEMLRLACCLATERGIEVVAPVHDAIMICSSLDRLDADIERTRAAMAEASRAVLGGFELRTDVHVFRYPDRYADKRGTEMWRRATALLERVEAGGAYS